jgi:hypothetical protein
MHAYKLQVTVPKDHDREISVHLPDDFPSGPAEVIVLADSRRVSRSAARPPQPTAAALKDLLSFKRTPEEEKILDDFDSFQREHPFSLNSLAEKP